MCQLSYFYTNNKNIFGRFYPHNKSYLGKSLSKQGAILLFWTKSYPKDNLNHDKNNKIQLLHIVLWTDGNNIYPYHLAIRPTCLQIVYPHEKSIIRLPSNISAPSDTLLWRWTSVYFDPVLKFSGLFHTAHLAGELWNSIQDQHWDLQLLGLMCRYSWDYARNY